MDEQANVLVFFCCNVYQIVSSTRDSVAPPYDSVMTIFKRLPSFFYRVVRLLTYLVHERGVDPTSTGSDQIF
jgi:hypothetical protein